MSETHIYLPSQEWQEQAHIKGMPAYQALVAESEADYQGYWARLAREFLSWQTPFTKVLNDSDAPFFKWFEDGRLNASYNCLDRHVEDPRPAGIDDVLGKIAADTVAQTGCLADIEDL